MPSAESLLCQVPIHCCAECRVIAVPSAESLRCRIASQWPVASAMCVCSVCTGRPQIAHGVSDFGDVVSHRNGRWLLRCVYAVSALGDHRSHMVLVILVMSYRIAMAGGFCDVCMQCLHWATTDHTWC